MILDRLIDIQIGMTYEEVIAKYPNPTNGKRKKEIFYNILKLINGINVTHLLLYFYNNKLYVMEFDYSNPIHVSLKTKYGYTPIEDLHINGYYGSYSKYSNSNIDAIYIDNSIFIIDNKIQKIVDSVGF